MVSVLIMSYMSCAESDQFIQGNLNVTLCGECKADGCLKCFWAKDDEQANDKGGQSKDDGDSHKRIEVWYHHNSARTDFWLFLLQMQTPTSSAQVNQQITGGNFNGPVVGTQNNNTGPVTQNHNTGPVTQNAGPVFNGAVQAQAVGGTFSGNLNFGAADFSQGKITHPKQESWAVCR
jgi:hypothetical protein